MNVSRSGFLSAWAAVVLWAGFSASLLFAQEAAPSAPAGAETEATEGAGPAAGTETPPVVPDVPDSIAIPSVGEPGGGDAEIVTETRTMIVPDVDAVEIPKELAGDQPKEEESAAMAEDANVEEEVSESESTVGKLKTVGKREAPLTAKALRARSEKDESGKVGSSVMTRTEARTFTFEIPAPRGQLLDRNGYPLAQSKVAYYAAINFPYLGSKVTDAEILRYAGERILHVNNILGSDWDLAGKAVINHYKDRRWVPLTFSSVLEPEEVDELNRQKMEGLTLHPVYTRHYPQGKTLGHVVGYVGKRPPRLTGPIVNDEPLWGQGMGVDGLEESFDADLRGKPGRINLLFREDGTKIKEDVLNRPRPGYNVVTSIDLEMQRICEEILAEKVKRGAMVIMDVRNGDIMAMASYPSFDPNLFIPSISQDDYAALVEDPDKPLYPRAYRALYPPASTFKVPVALGFLESGYISANDLYPCPSAWAVGNVVMRNWNKNGEGMMNVVGAITRSCNTWFYEVSSRAGADSMSYMATRLGLGQKTGIPLKEAEGFIPSNRWWLDKYGYMMTDGEEAVMSIGQGMVSVTPLQNARVMAAIGNGRQVLKPRLVLQIQDLNHEIVRSFPVEASTSLNVDGYSLRTVRRGMYDVVNAGNGTGRRAGHKITVSGKTGTGQWKVANKQNVAWFAGYFPSKYPVYSFAVIYEGEPGEIVGGGKNAAPVVGEFLERYLTEENYNKVRDMANVLKEQDPGDLEDYSYRDSMRPSSIFRGSTGETVVGGIIPGEEPAAQPPPPRTSGGGGGGGGLFKKIFGRGRR